MSNGDNPAIAGDEPRPCPDSGCINGLVEEPDDGYHEGYRWEPCDTCHGMGTIPGDVSDGR